MKNFQIRITIPTLGDFTNGFPVYDGLAKQYNPFPIILPDWMRMFKGIREFVSYQGFASTVLFNNEVRDHSDIFDIRDTKPWESFASRSPDIVRPFTTNHVENHIKENLNLDFEVNDNFQLKIFDIDVDAGDYVWAGDRWSQTQDHRRRHSFMGHIPGLRFLDYGQDIFYNLNIIQKSKYPFVSTFTGISILADLMNKENVVLWGEDMRNFMGWSPEFSFRKHYFTNRKSYIQYIDDFKVTDIANINIETDLNPTRNNILAMLKNL